MDVGSNQQWYTASTITSWHHFHSMVRANYQNLNQLWQCNNVRVHLYAYVPHQRMKKHFINVQCGCGKQSKVNYRLNHDIMASFPLDSHPELLKLTRPQRCNSVRVPSYAYIPHWKGLKHFIHIQCRCEKQSKVVYTLNHDIMLSYPPDSHPKLPTSDPASAAQ